MHIETNQQSDSWLNWMKDDISKEWGITLGPNSTARANGAVGGEITKRLVAISLQQLSETKQPSNWKIK
ncbi:small, acid-soluble spore protein, alpha/beta type [Bacillus cereus]|uniref:small, acid-soluble spore protein, alpha/beta type n=1 Tax=Bacillus cereus TaxID=1396 RepID=UPI000BEE26E8|nr:small, acid-soluble spore protein, alpha/beta type [Bacillus cereus]PEF60807.1 spore protein [Bacillus cereus]